VDPGLIGGLIGAFMGLVGGAIGTYASIRNTAGPRERAFMIRVARVVWVAVTAFVVALLVVPYRYKWLLWVAYVPALVTAIVWGNRRQRQIRLEEGGRR
jgi:Ca2+/Na+ antiporter